MTKLRKEFSLHVQAHINFLNLKTLQQEVLKGEEIDLEKVNLSVSKFITILYSHGAVYNEEIAKLEHYLSILKRIPQIYNLVELSKSMEDAIEAYQHYYTGCMATFMMQFISEKDLI